MYTAWATFHERRTESPQPNVIEERFVRYALLDLPKGWETFSLSRWDDDIRYGLGWTYQIDHNFILGNVEVDSEWYEYSADESTLVGFKVYDEAGNALLVLGTEAVDA